MPLPSLRLISASIVSFQPRISSRKTASETPGGRAGASYPIPCSRSSRMYSAAFYPDLGDGDVLGAVDAALVLHRRKPHGTDFFDQFTGLELEVLAVAGGVALLLPQYLAVRVEELGQPRQDGVAGGIGRVA